MGQCSLATRRRRKTDRLGEIRNPEGQSHIKCIRLCIMHSHFALCGVVVNRNMKFKYRHN